MSEVVKDKQEFWQAWPKDLQDLCSVIQITVPAPLVKQINAALEACENEDEKRLVQPLSLLHKMLADVAYIQLHEFLYRVMLYICSKMPGEQYPSGQNVPNEFLLVAIDRTTFDIRVLAQNLVISEQRLLNPITKKAFHLKDQQRVFALIQGKGLEMSASEDQKGNDEPTYYAGFSPDRYEVIKRDGAVVSFDQERIKNVIRKALLASDVNTESLDEVATDVAFQTIRAIKDLRPNGGVVHIEEIQNCVEQAFEGSGNRDVMFNFMEYRKKRANERDEIQTGYEPAIKIKSPDGTVKSLDKAGLLSFLKKLATGLAGIDCDIVVDMAYKNLYSGIDYHGVNSALIMVTRPLVEQDPNYSYFAARLLKHKLSEEVLSFFQNKDIQLKDPDFDYSKLLSDYVHRGVEHGYLSEDLLKFDLVRLSKAIKCDRDNQFSFFGLQTLYDRYFIHHKGTRIEMPQILFMRVAMGLALGEGRAKNKRAIEYYNQISTFSYMCATPTLFNSGTQRPQLSSCFLLDVEDSIEGIGQYILKQAKISQCSGGVGTSWTKVRASGSWIKGTNGRSSGVVPFLNMADATAIAVNQGGKRKGAVCAYLETWHLDIYDFLDLRKNSGDDRRRTHDMNTANWIPDLFMKRVIEKESWTLFSPDEVPNLINTYGTDFEAEYVKYEALAREGKIMSKTVEANHLWRKMLSMLYETGHPWMTYKCPSNIRNPQSHVGDIHSSNLCTEITLNTSKDEVAVCNLGSINLERHVLAQPVENTQITAANGLINEEMLIKTIRTAVRMLDNVIDMNYYSVPEAENSNMKHRPVGMGMMGFQEMLYRLGISYDTDEAVELADQLMEFISYHAIDTSVELAKERGFYSTYRGSLWDRGILPIDSIELLRKHRGTLLDMDNKSMLCWKSLREKMKLYGMRNSNVMAIAPTATIANISNTSQSIEPTYMNLAVKSTLSGEFTVVNKYLVADLRKLGLWDDVMVKELKYYNGSIQQIDRIPAEIRARYKTAFEVDPLWLIKCASRRQKWIDQSQSLNLYVANVSGKKLDNIYKSAWQMGLKTTYYLRAVGASDGEKSTIHDGKLNKVKREDEPQFCSVEDPDCEACQ
ncbi:ribonucleoside-diphosphate reductase subunit alpha [Candidatus Comchoanobacter bicostacola]|uniref:Vitamin B12-dependent ribonucleotide reductase n=2 Tax=Candidatus Comchoanobacter bicostacola TaxID=2919598 RepID=A0ABY5DKG8_9GAMM|nr:ribonucleoside-diphosphate reductase subunit alpha [Candidatus Comchoanobacter bicostacola]UTC24988.1 ribonucleoside-diphosphate reductase subunit alpha [Candidatus Comchoanobacter bicostacola]